MAMFMVTWPVIDFTGEVFNEGCLEYVRDRIREFEVRTGLPPAKLQMSLKQWGKLTFNSLKYIGMPYKPTDLRASKFDDIPVEIVDKSLKMFGTRLSDDEVRNLRLRLFGVAKEVSKAMETLEPGVGASVIYVDQRGNHHAAIVTADWGAGTVNVVFVIEDETRQDNYGRQIERATSVPHKTKTNVHGYYWMFISEHPNPYVAPKQV